MLSWHVVADVNERRPPTLLLRATKSRSLTELTSMPWARAISQIGLVRKDPSDDASMPCMKEHPRSRLRPVLEENVSMRPPVRCRPSKTSTSMPCTSDGSCTYKQGYRAQPHQEYLWDSRVYSNALVMAASHLANQLSRCCQAGYPSAYHDDFRMLYSTWGGLLSCKCLDDGFFCRQPFQGSKSDWLKDHCKD